MNIQNYRFGQMTVNGELFTRDLIILPDRIIPDWWRRDGHSLEPDDLKEILDTGVCILVAGTGAYGRMKILPETRKAAMAHGIRMEIAPTGDAWKIYNELSKTEKTAGAFHLTC